MKNIRGRKAFTMIELIIVIVILGILAGIAIVGYGAVVDRSKDASVEQAAASVDREARALAAFDQKDTGAELETIAMSTELSDDLPTGVTVTDSGAAGDGAVLVTTDDGTAIVTFSATKASSTPADIAVQ